MVILPHIMRLESQDDSDIAGIQLIQGVRLFSICNHTCLNKAGSSDHILLKVADKIYKNNFEKTLTC